ncbi:MAG: hypothetical protein JWM33_1475 [Caulobacteraceae bacterium]|nr:hypothetical protein [Caulobacteraceae bacterium]
MRAPITPDIDAFIQTRLRLAPAVSLPEISLYAAHPGSGLGRLGGGEDDPPPYWAWLWGGGAVLARHVLDHPETVAGRRVLDLGTGGGVVAIAAAKAGAASVIAADIDANAIVALRLNAAANGVEITPIHADLTVGDPPEVDLILVGDLFYAEDLAGRVCAFLDRCRAAGIEVLVGDPGRTPLPLDRLSLIAQYPAPDFGEAELKLCSVFAYGR